MKRLAAALLVAGGALFAGGTAVEAYPINSATVSVSDSTPAPGASFDVIVESCLAGTDVVFEFQGVSITVSCEASSNAAAGFLFGFIAGTGGEESGSATATFTAPTAAGDYDGTATVVSGDTTRELSFSVTVEAAATTTVAGQLPETGGGSSSTTTVTIAAVLLLAGAGMFAVANIRRRQTLAG